MGKVNKILIIIIIILISFNIFLFYANNIQVKELNDFIYNKENIINNLYNISNTCNDLLYENKKELDELDIELFLLNLNLSDCKGRLLTQNQKNEMLTTELENTRIDLNNITLHKNELSSVLNEMEGFYVPTLSRLKSIVSKSNIKNNRYDILNYNCIDYSDDLINHLKQNKIFSCVSYVQFNESTAHAFVAVNTTEGIVYIEPQSYEYFTDVKIGDNYCDYVNWNCDWNIIKFSSCYKNE